jgi:hypothetical protein
VTFYGQAEPFLPKFPPADVPRFLALQWMPRMVPPAYFFNVTNALVTGAQVVDPENPRRVFVELQSDPTPVTEGRAYPLDFRARENLKRRSDRSSRQVVRAHIFSNPNWNNYYHFIVDACVRYADLRLEGVLTRETRLLFHSWPNAWQKDYLDLMSIEVRQADVLDASGRSQIKVKDLLVGSPPRSRRLVSRRAAGHLRSLMLGATGVVGGRAHRRIYVTRRVAGKRSVVNESEVIDALAKRGFETVEAERLSAAEQVRTFAEAACIVAPHGAGLTNILFSELPNVIELVPADRWNLGGFAALTLCLGGTYTPLVSSSSDGAGKALRTDDEDADFSVDTDALIRILDARSI